MFYLLEQNRNLDIRILVHMYVYDYLISFLGIVACKLLPGNKFVTNETLYADPPKGHQSKYVTIDGNPTYVVQNPDQGMYLFQYDNVI